MKYKVSDETAIENEEGLRIVRLLPVSCTKKRCKEITKILRVALNEQHPTEDVVELRKAVLLAARWFKLYQEDETRYEHPASDADLLGMYDKMIAAITTKRIET